MRISDWSSDVCSSDLQGYIRGRSFAHPKLRLSFSVPAGFRLYNQSQAVIARDADGKAIIQFDRAPKPYGGAMTDYLTKVWGANVRLRGVERSEEHTSELQSLMRISYAVFCLKKKKKNKH